MKNLKIGVKLIGGFLIVALITLVVGAIGWWGVNDLDGHLVEVGDVRLPSIERLMETELVMEGIMLVHRTMMTERISIEQRQQYLAQTNESWQELDQTWARFMELPATAEEERLSSAFEAQLADWRRLDEQWRQHNQRFEALDVLDPADLVSKLQQFRGDHYNVQLSVAGLILNGQPFDGGDNPTTCNFGRWLASYTTQNPDFNRILTDVRTNHDIFHHAVIDIRQAVQDVNRLESRRLFSDVMQPAAEKSFAAFDQMIKVAEQANSMRNEMTAMVMGPMYTEAEEAMEVLKELTHINENIAKNAVEEAHAATFMAESFSIGGSAIGVVLALTLGFFLSRSISVPVVKGVELAREIAKGDFSMRLNMDRGDEIGILAKSLDDMAENLSRNADVAEQIADGNLNVEVQLASEKDQLGLALQTMVLNLNDILGQIQVAGEQIASGSGQVADSSQALSQGATESASSLEEISASLNQLSSQTGTNAENANTANQLSAEARNAAEQGSRKMQDMVAAMTEINEAGQSISKIIKVIDEIAFQTNLLALNAAVEAARAGQHGKGFAVVAEEVRNLAARSAKAAQETSELIEGSVQKTANGTAIADQTAEALQSIVSGIGKVTDLVAEIAAASSEQAQGVSQINQGVTQIDQVTQQNTASAEESAAASEELSSQAAQMREMLMRFTLKGGNSAHSNVRAVHQKTKLQTQSGWEESEAQPPKKIAAKKPIALDDDEFGKY